MLSDRWLKISPQACYLTAGSKYPHQACYLTTGSKYPPKHVIWPLAQNIHPQACYLTAGSKYPQACYLTAGSKYPPKKLRVANTGVVKLRKNKKLIKCHDLFTTASSLRLLNFQISGWIKLKNVSHSAVFWFLLHEYWVNFNIFAYNHHFFF